MIYRELESAFAAYLVADRVGTALADVPVRHAVPADPLGFPCVIVSAASAELLEGGVRNATRATLDFSIITAAHSGLNWQASHKDRVAALSRLLDDTNTNAGLGAINAGQTSFTLYGWSLTELASETAANYQTDTIRLSLVAGQRTNAAPSGTVATPQNYSLRHEIEQIVAAHLASVLPASVSNDYPIYPYYAENVAPSRRIVAACLSATRPFPQLARWTASTTIHIVTPGESARHHADVVQHVQASLRDITATDFTTAHVTVAGLLESGHTNAPGDSHLTDVLSFNLFCQQN
jgi:hypothetical protein